MGKLAKELDADLTALDRGETHVTESPLGDRGEPRPAASRANGRILLRLSQQEHATLVQEAMQQGVSLNHYLTEIVCGRRRPTTAVTAPSKRSPATKKKTVVQ